MAKLIVLALAGILVVVIGLSLVTVSAGDDVEAEAVLAGVAAGPDGYARAIGPWDWQFPRDHGAHPAFQTEWWYYTGNLADADGRRFGYQFTLFRRAIRPEAAQTDSEWRTNQVYMAHFTVSDVAAERFHQHERLSRGAAGLAGVVVEPEYRLWIEDWSLTGLDGDTPAWRLRAAAGDVAVDLSLEQRKPPALQGNSGLSPKDDQPGNASYYYSLSRLATTGTLTVGGQEFAVSGATWMDHEFSTSALGATALGWDWFGLHLDGERELMLGQIRLAGGGREPAFGGLLVEPDGTTRLLDSGDFTIESTATWTSATSGVTYPSGWRITVQTGDGDPLDLTLTPLARDQELRTEISTYWEGAVRIDGDATGYGYAELTGYASPMTGRF